MNAYVIFRFNPAYDLRPGLPAAEVVLPYTKVAVYSGRTAHDALRRFAADQGITITGGPAEGGHWLAGRKRLSSFGQSQFHADKTTLPANIAAAV